MPVLNPVLLFLFETQELRLGASSTWVAQYATVQNQASTQPSTSLLLGSCNHVSSILCSDRVTQYGQQLCQHCSAPTLLDIHLIAGLQRLADCWLEDCEARTERKGQNTLFSVTVYNHILCSNTHCQSRTLVMIYPMSSFAHLQRTGHQVKIKNRKDFCTVALIALCVPFSTFWLDAEQLLRTKELRLKYGVPPLPHTERI